MVGRIVCSKAGRDKDYFMVVIKAENGFVYVCDGKERPIERPKRKNIKHLQFTNTVLGNESYKTNKQLKAEIREDIKRLQEELEEAKYWGDTEAIEEIKDKIEVQKDELKRL